MTVLNIMDYGARGDGTNDLDAINDALVEGKKQDLPVMVPKGYTFGYAGIIRAESVVFFGEDQSATLFALDPTTEAIYLTGKGGAIRNLHLSGVTPPERLAPFECNRICVRKGASYWTVSDITVDGSSGCAVYVGEQAHHGKIYKVQANNTLADSIHMTAGCHDIEVKHNTINKAGDDGIAVVSYTRDGEMCHHITACHNRIINNLGGRLMSVVGGRDILYEDNELLVNKVAAGLYIAQEDSWGTWGAHDVTFRYNLLRGGGNPEKDHPAALIFSDGYEPCTNITLERNIITGQYGGVRVYGDCTDINLDANLILADPEYRLDTPGVVVQEFLSGRVGIQR